MTGNQCSAAWALRADAVIETIEKLHDRIYERFGDRGLTAAAAELINIGQRCAAGAKQAGKPNPWLNVLAVAIIIAGTSGLVILLGYFSITINRGVEFLALVQGTDAIFDIIMLSGLSIYSLIGIEKRVRRARALKGLYELRSIAHVVDMHQLTKDPGTTLGTRRTKSSPARDLDREGLLRYLDYCSEMLSLISKLAALYADEMHDTAVISTVNDIEDLTTALSRKIWQKIIVLQAEGPVPPRTQLN
jgi:hypothetical protein